ncbi:MULTISPECIES: hypothetical protein [unclassified Pseudomonas]|uniref:hypothetical protein n=1 Tax=unclassified Pseudomonas TaxID=196821 RepID=UPI00244A9CE0|nr:MULTISPECIES: hypothetical protein [unclassified Pseudomonas]MDH0305367.1 hypothetical protein [Pseudomonas sp. GD04091]MDH1988400.1 hypothetical protein [Pseudomonas sp. GD03689]
MSSRVPQAIVKWLEEDPDVHGWDMIVALPMGLVNQVANQSFLRHWVQDGGTRLKGEVQIGNTRISHQLDGYQLATPTLTVEKTDYGKSNLQLELTMAEGTHAIVRGDTEVMSLTAHTPINGFAPRVQVPLHLVGADLRLDLEEGSGHELTLGDSMENQYGASLLEDLFAQLPGHARVLDLAQVLANARNPFRDTRGVRIRAQVDDATGSQALLLFVTFDKGSDGFEPVSGAGFPFLLAEDAQQTHACTVILSRHLLHRTALGQAVLGAVEDGAFSYAANDGKPVSRMVAQGGRLSIPGGAYVDSAGGLEFEYPAFAIPTTAGAQALQLEFHGEHVEQRWQPELALRLRYRPIGEGAWSEHTVTVRPHLDYRFELTASEDPALPPQGRLTVLSAETAAVSGLPDSLAGQLEDITRAAYYIVRRGYLNTVSRRLTARLAEQILPLLRLPDGPALRPHAWALHNSLAMLGEFELVRPALRIEPQTLQIAAQGQHRFTVASGRDTLRWRVEALSDPAGGPGSIDADGLYTAPSAASLGGRALKVKVLAEDVLTGQASSALVEVVARTVVMSPVLKLIYRQQEGEAFLTASALSDAPLQWKIASDFGGTLESTGDRSCTYTSGEPRQDRTYVVDKIQATGPASAEVGDGVILVVHKPPTLTIHQEGEPSPEGTLKLKATQPGNGTGLAAQWSLEGPGRIDADGLYQADPQAQAAFVIVFASYERLGIIYEGHLVLPLPLSSFPALRGARMASGRLASAMITSPTQEKRP